MDEPVHFYRVTGEFGAFSNFAPSPFTLDGLTWPTAEHYFQAQKFQDAAYRERIRTTKSPMIAARLGRSRKVPLRSDWERVKEDVMRTALRAKFGQNPPLKALLASTEDRILVERTAKDSTWGDGGDGSGRNRLGVLLMEIRKSFRG